jgi:hypothetical protein
MINRFRTRCKTCGHHNTLRITIGTEQRQEHTFACAGCGIPTKVALEVDFKDRVPLAVPEGLEIPEKMKEMFSQPRTVFHALENCELCEEEGTITNLDPNFLVPEELLHKDQVFSWMMEARRIGMLDKDKDLKPKPHINDIIHGIGGVRELKRVIAVLTKAWALHVSGNVELRDKVLQEFASSVKITDKLTVAELAGMSASVFLGRSREAEVQQIIAEAQQCYFANPDEYEKLRARLRANFDEVLGRQIGLLDEYGKAYDQLSQTYIYAVRGTKVDGNVVASSKDLRAVRMFYGNCFEEVAAGFELPACLNNIRKGRPYDQFAQMSLAKYLSINKAGRAKSFADNAGFASLHDEFESTIRNASHHSALRLNAGHPEIIEYRSGDEGKWRRMPFAEYLLRCNRIMMCAMRLLLLQFFVAEDIVVQVRVGGDPVQ